MNSAVDLQTNRPPKRTAIENNSSVKSERCLNRSSSESDVSTTASSMENLTNEERFVLRHMRRQDPQGQEKETFLQTDVPGPHNTSVGPFKGLDIASSCGTLIIHDSLSEDSWARLGSIQDLGGTSHFTSTPNNNYRTCLYSNPCLGNLSVNSTRSLPRSAKDFTALGYLAESKGHLGSSSRLNKSLLKQNDPTEQAEQMKILEKLALDINTRSYTLPRGPQIFDSFPVSASSSFSSQVNEASDPSLWSRLSISDTLFADESKNQIQNQESCETNPSPSYAKDFSYLSKPPPAYPRRLSNASKDATTTSSTTTPRKTRVRRALSRSHPDLSKLGKDLGIHGTDRSPLWKGLRERRDSKTSLSGEAKPLYQESEKSSENLENVSSPVTTTTEISHEAQKSNTTEKENEEAVWTTPELVDAILEENFELRKKVQSNAENVIKLQRFEEELSAVHKTHEAVIRSCERREQLERSVRIRLEAELRRLQEINLQLRNQVDVLTSQLSLKNSATVSSNNESQNALQKEIARRDAIIAQLVSQNNELSLSKERQDLELCAQRATLQEQRSNISILESALNNAQMHITRLEEHCRQKSNAEMIQSNIGAESLVQANKREVSNLQTRIRDLELKLAEKDTIIRVIQRSSVDKETPAPLTGSRLPEPVTLINRLPPQQTPFSQMLPPYELQAALQQVTDSIYSQVKAKGCKYPGSPASSLPGSARGSAASVASSSGGSAPVPPPPMGHPVTANNNVMNPGRSYQAQIYNSNSETVQMLDEQIRVLDRALQPKHSLIQALRSDRERFPNYYAPS